MTSKIAFLLRGIALVTILIFSNISTSEAQCPMCRMTLESNMRGGGSQGSGMNAGIMYLLFTPYIMVGGIAYVWYRNRKRKDDFELEEELEAIA
jgi:hypothetical protein